MSFEWDTVTRMCVHGGERRCTKARAEQKSELCVSTGFDLQNVAFEMYTILVLGDPSVCT